MRGKTARFLWAVCIAGGLVGFCVKAEPSIMDRESGKETLTEWGAETCRGASAGTVTIMEAEGQFPETERGGAAGTEEDEAVSDMDVPLENHPLEGKETGTSRDAGERKEGDAAAEADETPAGLFPGVPKTDTVDYVPSERREILKPGYVKTTVDEKDPGTYQVVEREQKIPVKYVDDAGNVKYFYEDGIWYEYKYSLGDITLDEKNQELALKLLNFKGSYEDYEVIQVECSEQNDGYGGMQYEYHVRYRRAEVMEASPAQMAHQIPGGIGKPVEFRTVKIREKIPVTEEVRIGTGEYRYYGWQVLDGNTFYFDKYGEKVTGIQVIQGICHEFDENGVKISSAGIDVSEKNGEIDWKAAAAAGVDFAMIRCMVFGEGDGLAIGAKAETQLETAQAAGMETGICLIMQASSEEEAVKEAESAVRLAGRYGLRGPIAVCCAGAAPGCTRGTDGLDPSARTACIRAFCSRIRDSGYEPLIRAEAGWLLEGGLRMEELGSYGLWRSQYDTGIGCTGPCTFRQYTREGRVDGINGYTGLIIGYGKQEGISK